MNRPRTIIEKLWDSHVVHEQTGAPALLYIDLHLVHEVTSPQAFESLRRRGLKVRRPDLTFATADHSIPTTDRSLPIVDQIAAKQVAQLEINCKQFGIPLEGIHGKRQGIVHVIGPELGLTQPGMTVVCGDSHTATHGAFGALAFGIGTSEVEHVLATQCLLQRKSKSFEVRVEGKLKPGVSAKDIILALIANIAKALKYMGLEGGKPLLGHPIDVVFIGSCTNSRISDLRTAAGVLKGRKVNPKVRVMVVPGSQEVKRMAIAEGLPEIFREAGCEWREPGCSMCIAMNGDQLSPGQYSVSTSNRNFEGRQGKGGRTFLASPLTAAASAITGVVTDVRTIL